MAENLISVKNLSVTFSREGKKITPVRDVTFTIPKAGRIAIVGESGCGKSLTALSLAALSPVDRALIGGAMEFPAGRDETRISYVFQNPSESLNPVMRIGDQIREALAKKLSRSEAKPVICRLLERVLLPDPERAYHAYPCELSGGQQQRCMIAMALAAEPDVLVADEPTTALDVTTQKEVLTLIDSLAGELGMAVLLITHNLGLVAKYMDFVYVMYAGMIVESGKVEEVLLNPRHPYTHGLKLAIPQLNAPRNAPLADIPGTVPPPDNWPQGCAFAPRCKYATDKCRKQQPQPVAVNATHSFSCWNA